MPARPIDALIDRTPLRAREELRVTLDSYRGQQYLAARRFYQQAGSDVWHYGKGLAVRVDLLPWLRHALQVAEATALETGLLEAEDYSGHGLPVPASLEAAA